MTCRTVLADVRYSAPGDSWPLQSFLEFGAYAGAVRCARLHARQVAWEWGLGELENTCAEVVSELVTNAVVASRALDQFTGVRLWLLSDKDKLLILVWDAHPGMPAPRVVDENTGESGRGLFLVGKMSEQWGWYATEPGKVVWALIAEAVL